MSGIIRSCVRGAIVNRHDLEILATLLGEAVEAFLEELLPVVDRQKNGYGGCGKHDSGDQDSGQVPTSLTFRSA